MANLTITELLQPQVIVDTVSQVRAGRGALSKFFNFDIGNPKIKQIKTDSASYRIFNETRQVSTFRLNGVGPAVITPNPVGETRFYILRMYEKMVFSASMLGNIAKIGGPNSEQDEGGADYVESQMAYIGKRFNWGTEVMAAGFARGTLYLSMSGDQIVPYLTQPSGKYITVSFGLSSTNYNQLSMGTGTPIIQVDWASPAAPIVQNLLQIRAAMVAQTGMQLKCLMLNSVTWGYVINNVSVRAVGGVVQAPHDAWTMEPAKDEHGNEMYGLMRAKIKAIPWLDFLINDDNISIGNDLDPVNTGNSVGTLTKVIPDGVVLFSPTPDPTWVQMVHGGEWVAENYGVKDWTWKQGLSSWKHFSIEPTAMNISTLMKGVPIIKVPNAYAWGTVSGFTSPS